MGDEVDATPPGAPAGIPAYVSAEVLDDTPAATGAPTSGPSGPVRFRLGYQPAFDGMRGVGITTFMFYHYGMNHVFPGAYFFLDLFLVQSGFLISSLLVEEWQRTGRISLKNFYIRRAARLLPVLFFVVGLVSLYAAFFGPQPVPSRVWHEVFATLFYWMNWLNALSPHAFPYYLAHCWTLAVEEQFYVVAPWLVLAAFRFRVRNSTMFWIMSGLALASFGWMNWLAHHGATWQRVYYGTDTRAFPLLIGVALTFAVQAGWLFRSERFRARFHVLGWIATIFMVVVLFRSLKLEGIAVYRTPLFLFVSIAVAVILADVMQRPDGAVARFLSLRWLRWVGSITYGLYIWHWPIFYVIFERTSLSKYERIALAYPLTFAVAALSYYLLERPILVWARRFRSTTSTRPEGALGVAAS